MRTRTPTEQPELRLSELSGVLRRRRWQLMWFVILSTSAAGIASLLLPQTYKAVIIMSPAPQSPMTNGQLGSANSLLSGVGGLGGGLGAGLDGGMSGGVSGGLSSLTSLAAGNGNKRAESIATLESEALTEKYIQQNNLLPILFRKQWDAQRRQWRATDPDEIPTLWKGNQYFKKKVRTVLTDTQTGIVTLTIAWHDPQVAATWANGLVALTNEYLRAKTIAESERNIAFLNAQAAKTDLMPIKRAIYTVLQNEIDKEMLARGNNEYAFKILDPAQAPESPSFPRPVFFMFVALLGSLGVAVFAAYVRLAWERL